MFRDGDGDTAATGADISDAPEVGGICFEVIDDGDDSVFGFAAGDEDSGVHVEVEGIEFLVSDEVGDGFSFFSAEDESLVFGAFFGGGFIVEGGVEVDSLAISSVCKENFGVEAWGIGAVFFEEAGCPFEEFANGPGLRVAHHSSISPRRASRSCSRRASVTGWQFPAMIWSSL